MSEDILLVLDADLETSTIIGSSTHVTVFPLSTILNYVDVYRSPLRGRRFTKVLLPERLQDPKNADLLGRALSPIYHVLNQYGEGYKERVKFY